MAHRLEQGTVISVREVVIDGTASNTGRTVGGILGGAVGAAASPSIEDDRDLRQAAGTVAVATVAGVIVGPMIEKRLTEKRAQEMIIQLDEGDKVVVIQEIRNPPFEAMERVQVYTNVYGSSRVFHADEDPYLDPETKGYLISEEELQGESPPVTW